MRTYADWRLSKDGDHWLATAPGFIDVDRSPCGYGETKQEAIDALLAEPVILARLASSGRKRPRSDSFVIDVDVSA